MISGGYRFLRYLARGGLFNINLEVTKRCNARCDFCDYWAREATPELADYVPVVKKLQPLSVSLTGGEPLLREDLVRVIRDLRGHFSFLYISLITNGWLLTRERGLGLWEAGLDELSISLDYLDERHDEARGLPGLARHILKIVPELRAGGVNLCLNVVIKRGNFREIPRMLCEAAQLGAKVSLSTYNCWRTNNEVHMIGEDELPALKKIIDEVKEVKRNRHVLTTSDYYLDRIPEFFRHRSVPGCTAGLNWVQVTPDGMIKRCSDHPAFCGSEEWRPDIFEPTRCDRCWYSCRGAAQEPWTVKRFLTMAGEALAS
jgi:MoaA/NifB/PqqE/SkfB family radical SAM enzyme